MARKLKNTMQNLKQRSLIAHFKSKSPIAEQYRTIRTNIEFAAVDEEIRTLIVTSAGPGEGKSTTTANLAVVMAQQGKKVLLVDADLRKPTVHYTFQAANNQGLTNVLTNQRSLNQAVVETEVENLAVLTSGPVPPNPSELLGSKSFEQLIEEALKTYDIVLFDTPPVLAVTDAQVLANRCQGSILVAASGKTETESAVKAKEALDNANAKLLGVVLNQKAMKQGQYYYYYGNK